MWTRKCCVKNHCAALRHHSAQCRLPQHLQRLSNLQHTRIRHIWIARRSLITTTRPQIRTRHALNCCSNRLYSASPRLVDTIVPSPHHEIWTLKTTIMYHSHSYSSIPAMRRLRIQQSCNNRTVRHCYNIFYDIPWLWMLMRRLH